MKYLYTILLSLFFVSALAQQIDISDLDDDDSTIVDESITYYDRFNKVFGGDSIRYAKGAKCVGQVKDLYPNGNIKHKGVYENGRLVYYKNYYENGQEERSFKAKGTMKHSLELYYKTGQLKSKVEYFKGDALIWQDFYPNGQMEFYEEYDKSFEFYILQKFFYDNGQLTSILELVDKKSKKYISKEYFRNGQIKEEGIRYFSIAMADYLKEGIWKIYNEQGKLIAEEDYVKGRIINEKTY
ncbi:MAG: hypothetical protein K9J13_14115 [Saprospiraceae bacterium]|nr:hypothetical protein [Saprospiraceae bacterium]